MRYARVAQAAHKTARPLPPSGSRCKRRAPESPTQLPQAVTVHTARESSAVPGPVGSAFSTPRPEAEKSRRGEVPTWGFFAATLAIAS